jgi:hypothetical protein
MPNITEPQRLRNTFADCGKPLSLLSWVDLPFNLRSRVRRCRVGYCTGFGGHCGLLSPRRRTNRDGILGCRLGLVSSGDSRVVGLDCVLRLRIL